MLFLYHSVNLYRLSAMSISNFSYLPFLLRGQDFASDCTSSGHVLLFTCTLMSTYSLHNFSMQSTRRWYPFLMERASLWKICNKDPTLGRKSNVIRVYTRGATYSFIKKDLSTDALHIY